MADARRALRSVVAALCAVALVSGCSGIPSSSPANVVRRVPAEGPEPPDPQGVRRVPPEIPPADDPPDEIVRAFLLLQPRAEADHAPARRYLAPQVEWDPTARTVVYADRRTGKATVRDDRATVAVTFETVGTITGAGEYRPRSVRVTETFRLRRIGDLGWRISDVPRGVLLAQADVLTMFQRATLYWPDQARRLVPDFVFQRVSDQPVAAIARAMLEGPRGWLAPAVRSAIPPGTELLRPPELVDGVVTLTFSREVRRAPQETLGAMVAQVVWTLTERTEVHAVRLVAEDEPVDVPGRPGLRDHRRADWVEYAPAPPTADRRLFFVRDGVATALDEGGRTSRVARTPPLESVSVNRAGTLLAAVTRPAGGRRSLLVVDLAKDEVRTAATAVRFSAPTWEPGGEVVWAVQSTGVLQQVVTVRAASGVNSYIDLPPSLAGPVTALRVSPDGGRAAVVAGPAGRASLWVARVERPASGGRVLGEPLRIVPTLRGVTAVAFDGAGSLLFATRSGGARPALYRVGLDGFDPAPQRVAGLPAAEVTALAVSAGQPPDRVASAAGRLWRRTPSGDWAPLTGSGVAAAFAG